MPSPGQQASPAAALTPRFAGHALDRPLVMGVINVTPDSFTDGGETFTPDAAIARGRAMLDAGADILDVGGEATSPGVKPTDPAIERERILPVVAALAGAGATVSIDTRHAIVMQAALDAGAAIVNDITALTGDPEALRIVAASDAAVVLMHMQGEPETMNRRPAYDDVVGEVADYLATRVAACEGAGMPRQRIAVDPGIGFGKTPGQNFQLLGNLNVFAALGCALMVGVSRKFGRADAPQDRLARSVAMASDAAARGANILRVHDVPETVAALQR